LGEFLLQKGMNSPFVHLGSAYMYPDLEEVKHAMKKIGNLLATKGIPKKISPLVFAFTSSGRVSQGAQEMFRLLPHKFVSPEELKDIVNDPNASNKLIYATIIETEHMVRPKDPSKKFDKRVYYAHPEDYEPIFHEEYLPYISVIINCMYWERKFPRIVTDEQIQELVNKGRSRLLGVCDITCDFQGSVEFLKKFTSIEHPFYVYDIVEKKVFDNISDTPTVGKEGQYILFHAVDHLPAELPKEASSHFGEKLFPFIKELALSDGTLPFDEQYDYAEEMKKAVICCHGKLCPNYKYIFKIRDSNEKYKKSQIKLEEHELKQIKDEIESTKPSHGLKRVASYMTVEIIGHLFDMNVMPLILDALEELNTQFRVLEWNVGQNKDEKTTVSLQIFCKNKAVFEECFEKLFEIAGKFDVDIREAQSQPNVMDVYQTSSADI